MQMPRFSVKLLLIAMAVISLWLASFALDYGGDVRAGIILFGLLAALFAAAYSHGERRAFWSGFFLLFLLFRIRQGVVVVPTFDRLTELIISEPAQGGIPLAQQNMIFAARTTVTLVIQLILAVAAGVMAAIIFRWSRSQFKE
jgi:hypothetical protein